MKRFMAAVAVLACLGMSVTSSAGFPERVYPHGCVKPYKPLHFTSESELQSFKDEVRQYKECIEEYVQDQEDAIKDHRKAANDAIEEWNSYARYELN